MVATLAIGLKDKLKAYEKTRDYYEGCWQYQAALDNNNNKIYYNWNYNSIFENKDKIEEIIQEHMKYSTHEFGEND